MVRLTVSDLLNCHGLGTYIRIGRGIFLFIRIHNHIPWQCSNASVPFCTNEQFTIRSLLSVSLPRTQELRFFDASNSISWNAHITFYVFHFLFSCISPKWVYHKKLNSVVWVTSLFFAKKKLVNNFVNNNLWLFATLQKFYPCFFQDLINHASHFWNRWKVHENWKSLLTS